MASNNYQTALCLKIIHEHFGIVTKNVAKELFKHEVATLPLLVRVFHDTLTPDQIKQALVVLLQHDCAFVEYPPQPPGGVEAPSSSSGSIGKGVNYRINSDAVINRLRHPSLLLVIKSLFGDIGVFIMECFIEHGHINLPHLGREVIAARRLDAAESLASSSSLSSLGDADDETILKEMRATFEAMIADRYICAVPHLTIRKSTLQEQHQRMLDATNTRKTSSASTGSNSSNTLLTARRANGSTSSSSGVAFESTETVVRRKRAATPMARAPSPANFASSGGDDFDSLLPVELRVGMKAEEQRAALEPHQLEEEATLEFGDAGQPVTKKKRVVADESDDDEVTGTGRASAARRTPSPQIDVSSSDCIEAMSESLWTINWDQYVRYKRHMLCVVYCRSRMGPMAGTICDVLLKHSLSTERDCCTKQSDPLSASQLFQKMSALSGRSVPALNLDNMRKLLDLMVQYAILSANIMLGSEQKYSVNIGSILDNLKQKTIHNVVCEKYGVQAGRIIEVLRHHKYVEQQAISDYAIVPAREAREKLYALFQDKWVNYYEVSKSGGNTYAPSSTVYLWYYNNADGFNTNCNRTLINNLYMVIYKLGIRYAHEIEEGRTLVEVGKDTMSKGGANMDTVELLQLRLNRLQRSIFEVTDTLFLFEL